MGRALSLAAGLALAAVAGCGSGGEAPSDGAALSADGAFTTCDTETRAMPYQAGMQVMSSAGVFTIKLLGSTPAPPIKGQNTWTLEVDEAATGTPLDDLDLSVNPWMPDHGHGQPVPVGVTPAGAGTYTLAPVYLYMSGFWQVKMTIVAAQLAGNNTDSGLIPICIP
jgi:hypothetical protein